jgi:hypothetical protein
MNERLIADALQRTAPDLYSSVDGGNTWQSAIKKRGARTEKFRRYERGDHDSNLTTQQRKLLNIVADEAELNESNSNYCSIVVDMMAGRLSISEVTTEDEQANEWINDTLQRNGFVSKQGEWFRGAIRDSESYVLIDPQTAMWSSEPAYDGYSGVVALFDSMTQLPVWACKLWSISEQSDVSGDEGDKGEENTVYVVVYQPDRITYWKGATNGGSVSPVIPASKTSLTMLESGNGYAWPLGVIPLIQFANKRDNYTPYGESEIRCVLPLQDIVNSTLYDMTMSSKLSAFKIYWSIGMEVDKDGIVPGSVINLVLKDSSNNIVIDENTANYLRSMKVGEFGTTDMSQYTNQLDKLEREISQVSSTPVYGITAQGNLSGEALKQLESGLVNKIIRFQNENDASIKMLLKMTSEIQKMFDVNTSFVSKFTAKVARFLGLSAPQEPPANIDDISINWKSPEIINVSVQINALSQLRRDNPGLWPDDWYRERLGGLLAMSSTQITDEGDKAKMEQVSAFDQLIGGAGNVPLV